MHAWLTFLIRQLGGEIVIVKMRSQGKERHTNIDRQAGRQTQTDRQTDIDSHISITVVSRASANQ